MDQGSPQRKIIRNVLYGFSTWILPISLSFVVTPILVKTLGNVEYGIYALVLGFIAYSFNFNIGRAATRYIADYKASRREKEIGKIVSSTLILNLTVGSIGLIVIYFLSPWLVVELFNIELPLQTTSISAIRISGLIIFLMMVSQVFTSIIQGYHRFDIYAALQNFSSLSGLIGNLILALIGYGLIELLYWNLLIISISCFFSLISCIRLLSGINLFTFSKESLKLVSMYSSGVIGYQIAANALLLFERGWVTSKFGPSELTYYVVPMSLAMLLHGFIVSLTMVIFPTVSEIGLNRQKLLRIYLMANKFVSLIIVLPAFFLIFYSNEILSYWIGKDFSTESTTFLILHVLTFTFASMFVVSFQVAEGLGKTRLNFMIMLFGLIFATPLMIISGVLDSPEGIALVRTITFFLMLLNYLYFERYLFEKIQFRFWLKTFSQLLFAAGIGVFSTLIIKYWFDLSLPILGLMAFMAGIVYLITLRISGFVGSDEKSFIFGRIPK